MPRAGKRCAAEFPFTQGTALVWANTIESVKFTIDIDQRHDQTAGHGFQSLTRWAVFDSGDANPIGHVRSLQF